MKKSLDRSRRLEDNFKMDHRAMGYGDERRMELGERGVHLWALFLTMLNF
jgi:hypothetical protein